MSPQTLTATLGALRKAGSVIGVVFAKDTEILYNDAPFVPERMNELVGVLDDIAFYFEQEKKDPDQLAFGYDGGNLAIVLDGSYRILVLHAVADEVDFIAKAARSFLKDYQMSIFAGGLVDGSSIEESRRRLEQSQVKFNVAEEGEEKPARVITEQITAQAKKASDMTEPVEVSAPRPSKTDGALPPRRDEPKKESGYVDETVPAAKEKPKPNGPLRKEIQEEIAREKAAGARERAKDSTGPILAPSQPDSTLPAPRKPKIRR